MRRRGRSDAHHDADDAEPVMAVPIRGRSSGWIVGGPGVEDQAGGDGEAEGGGFEEGRRSSGFRGVEEACLALMMRSDCVPQKARP